MTYIHKYLGVAAIAILVLLTAFGLYYTQVSANPSPIQRATPSNSAATTTAFSYMTAGTATTTFYMDTQLGASTGMDRAAFLVQFMGSSSVASTLNIAFEYSPGVAGTDCTTSPAACDWYADNFLGDVNAVGTTTTGAHGINTPNSYTLLMASSTVGGAGGIAARTTRTLSVSVPARYVRAVTSLPLGSLNGAVWAEFDGKKQNP